MTDKKKKLPILINPAFHPEEEVYTICNGLIVKAVVTCFALHDTGECEMEETHYRRIEKQGFYKLEDRNCELTYHLRVIHPNSEWHGHVVHSEAEYISSNVENLIRKLKKKHNDIYGEPE